MPMESATKTIKTSFRTPTQASSRIPLEKTNPANRVTEIIMAGVRPMLSKLEIETIIPRPVRVNAARRGELYSKYSYYHDYYDAAASEERKGAEEKAEVQD